MTKVVIHTDGGCQGNPGPGGWAAILQSGSHRKELKGGEEHTTNNRMELTAAIEALQALKRPCRVELWTDSKYLQQGVKEWMPKWKANGWQRKEGGRNKEVKNLDLWQSLDRLIAKHTVEFHWLKGHNGHPLNERCDQLTQEAIAEVRQK